MADGTRTLMPIVDALTPQEREAMRARALARAEERKRKRSAFLTVPERGLDAGGHWYVVRSEASRELLAAEEIDKLGFRIWVPSYEKEIVNRRSASRSRKYEIVRRVVFPTYFFVGFGRDAPWAEIAHARGVAGMVMAGNRPEPMPDPQIDRVMHDARYNFGQPVRRVAKFKPGERVRAIDGPFGGLEGDIEVVDTSMRITVLLALFGRKVRVTLVEEMLELVD